MPRWLRSVLFYVVIPILGWFYQVVMLVLIFIYTLPGDIPPIDDAALSPLPIEVAPGEDAYPDFAKAGGAFVRTAGANWFRAMDRSNQWDRAVIETMAASNRVALAHIRAGNAKSGCRLPDVDTDLDRIPHLSPWGDLARLLAAEAILLGQDGQSEKALDSIKQCFAFGNHLERAPNHHITWGIGALMQLAGYKAIHRLAEAGALNDAQLAECQDLVRARVDQAASLACVARNEYAMICRTLDVVSFQDNRFEEKFGMKPNRWLRMAPVRRLNHLNRTRALMYPFYEGVVTQKERTFAEVDLVDYETVRREIAKIIQNDPVLSRKRFVNLRGHFVFFEFTPDSAVLFKGKCNYQFMQRGFLTLLGLYRYKAAQGEWPESLDLLVPNYFDAVPIDPFDGMPIRYNPDLLVVYSVGENLEDDGGVLVTPKPGSATRQLDLVFPLVLPK